MDARRRVGHARHIDQWRSRCPRVQASALGSIGIGSGSRDAPLRQVSRVDRSQPRVGPNSDTGRSRPRPQNHQRLRRPEPHPPKLARAKNGLARRSLGLRPILFPPPTRGPDRARRGERTEVHTVTAEPVADFRVPNEIERGLLISSHLFAVPVLFPFCSRPRSRSHFRSQKAESQATARPSERRSDSVPVVPVVPVTSCGADVPICLSGTLCVPKAARRWSPQRRLPAAKHRPSSPGVQTLSRGEHRWGSRPPPCAAHRGSRPTWSSWFGAVRCTECGCRPGQAHPTPHEPVVLR